MLTLSLKFVCNFSGIILSLHLIQSKLSSIRYPNMNQEVKCSPVGVLNPIQNFTMKSNYYIYPGSHFNIILQVIFTPGAIWKLFYKLQEYNFTRYKNIILQAQNLDEWSYTVQDKSGARMVINKVNLYHFSY